jgi:hypothetical protein
MQNNYKQWGKLSFDEKTPDEICHILVTAHNTGSRIILDYGDTETGQSWGEVNDIRGTVGHSCGEIKIPLLIKTSRSTGGGAILDHRIVKLTDAKTGFVLYQHPTYKPSENK